MLTERLRVDTYDKKYTVIQDHGGGIRLLRYGEPWSDPGELIRYSNMILSLAIELRELREKLKEQRGTSR